MGELNPEALKINNYKYINIKTDIFLNFKEKNKIVIHPTSHNHIIHS